jgi:hypothetical protein
MNIRFVQANEREPLLRSIEPRTVFSGLIFGGDSSPRIFVRTTSGALCLQSFYHSDLDGMVQVRELKILGKIELDHSGL